MRSGAALLAFALLFLPGAAAGQALSDTLGLGGSLRAGYWSSSRMLDDRRSIPTAAVWLDAAPGLGPNGSLRLDGWIGRQSAESGLDGRLREGYLRFSAGPLDLRIGQQVIAWGRADRINPTDYLGPRDFTRLLPDDDDQRLGTPALKATYYLRSVAVTAIILPYFTPNEIPLPVPPRPLAYQNVRPDRGFRQVALKLEQTGGAIDGSLSYFSGFDPSPDLALDQTHVPFPRLRLEHHRLQVVGADAATTVGRFGLRAEAAYTWTEDPQGNRPEIKNPFLFLVAGGDRTFFETLNLNLQYVLIAVTNYRAPDAVPDPFVRGVAVQEVILSNQLDRRRQGMTARISNRWLHETLEAEVAGVVFFPRRDYALRPKLRYAFTDRWTVIVGGDLFRGREPSMFGFLERNSTVYAELRRGF